MNIVSIGEVARAALARSRGMAVPIPKYADSPYFEAAGEIIWVGARIPALHPRAVMTEFTQPRGVTLRFDSLPDTGWARRLPALDPTSAARVASGVGKLCETLVRIDAPRGFGALLAGIAPGFPLDLATARVTALADAYRRNDCECVFTASIALLGFGTGLTPSGDDLAGAALFGRKLIAPDCAHWLDVAERLCHEVAARSHEVSAALFRDLAFGRSFAPLHTLAEALAGNDGESAMQAARTLVAIGHSSGWDMMTGFVIGAGGTLS